MTPFEDYFKDLQGHKIADITEHSHRKSLQNLLESIASKQKGKFKILHEPKREGRFGSPDFKITSTESVLGYVENKKVDENLDKTLKTDQVKKYIELSNNILLTNYIEWIWIKNGEVTGREVLCNKADIENRKAKLDTERAEKVEALIAKFFFEPPQKISNAKLLAEALAIRAKLLKDFLHEELKRQEKEHTEGRLYQLFETFRSFIFQELTLQEFADAFAQNLVYGLFLAKLNADTKQVDIYNAKKFIPNSFELIRELVNFLDELDNEEYKETKWIVEEVLTILNNLDLREINRTLHFSKTKTTDLFGENEYFYKDPFVYFYEHFLSVYDKKLREAKGVYYTPPPVVNFIVRAVNDIIKEEFKIKEGLANRERVTVLDFATGTGTFLLEVFQQIFDSLPKGSAKKDGIVKEHILKNIYGFEYLIAPYTIAHLKLSQFLKDQGYTLQPKERLQVFLTNTLEPIENQIKIPLLPALTEESKHAQEVKDKPILVITGNPPYSIHSKNNGLWIKNKVEDYKFSDGAKIKDKGLNGLQDDYVKFIRFAQDKIDAVEEGVVAIITNHTFSFSSTYRGMRKSLMDTFNVIHFIDLHGNNILKEKTPQGTKDENVFDIEQGVGISIFIKKKGLKRKVLHSNIYGLREEKYKFFLNNSLKDLETTNAYPHSPFYSFKPLSAENSQTYNVFPSVLDIFKVNGTGTKFRKDNLLVHFTFEAVKEMLKTVESGDKDAVLKKYNFEETDDWQYEEKKTFFNSKETSDIVPVNYRPFDTRFTYYPLSKISKIIPRGDSRANLMKNFLRKKNMALCIGKAGNVIPEEQGWNLAFCTNAITDMNVFYRGGAVLFPLLVENGDGVIISNIKDEFNFSGTPNDTFAYIYSILYSSVYKEKYSDFLKIDFPRIPFSSNKKVFGKLVTLGQKLLNAHLLVDTSEFNDELGNYMGGKNHVVEQLNFVIENGLGKLYINSTNYFNNVPKEIFYSYIGGYQVVEKYLKERKGRSLISNEIDQAENIIRCIAFTHSTTREIDKLTKDWI